MPDYFHTMTVLPWTGTAAEIDRCRAHAKRVLSGRPLDPLPLDVSDVTVMSTVLRAITTKRGVPQGNEATITLRLTTNYVI